MKYEPIVYKYKNEKALNFRELGGYPAKDGRKVKKGIFHRGPSTSFLIDEKDKAQFEELGIKTILDFRSIYEAENAPDWIPDGCERVRIGGMHFADGQELDFSPAAMEKMTAMALQNGGTAATFLSLYRLMPFGNPAFHELFRRIENEQVPIFFHCTAGKDRTGIAAALILLALGVDRETVLDDYEYTNVCRKPIIDEMFANRDKIARYRGLSYDELSICEGVSRSMAAATLDAIEQKYPTYEAYFEDEFGLTDEKLAALRDKYLE